MRKKQCNTDKLFSNTDDFELTVVVTEISEKKALPNGETVTTHKVEKTTTFASKGGARNKSKSSAAKMILFVVVSFVGLLADIPDAMSLIDKFKSLL